MQYGLSDAASEAVRQALGGGCRSGWGRLLSVTNAIEVGTLAGHMLGTLEGGRGSPPPIPMHPRGTPLNRQSDNELTWTPPPPALRSHHYLVKPSILVSRVLPAHGGGGGGVIYHKSLLFGGISEIDSFFSPDHFQLSNILCKACFRPSLCVFHPIWVFGRGMEDFVNT